MVFHVTICEPMNHEDMNEPTAVNGVVNGTVLIIEDDVPATKMSLYITSLAAAMDSRRSKLCHCSNHISSNDEYINIIRSAAPFSHHQ